MLICTTASESHKDTKVLDWLDCRHGRVEGPVDIPNRR